MVRARLPGKMLGMTAWLCLSVRSFCSTTPPSAPCLRKQPRVSQDRVGRAAARTVATTHTGQESAPCSWSGCHPGLGAILAWMMPENETGSSCALAELSCFGKEKDSNE